MDNSLRDIESLDPETDPRTFQVRVAGPAALLVSKLYKLHERLGQDNPDRQQDKDAHDIYRILVETELGDLQVRYQKLQAAEISLDVATTALGYLDELFAAGAHAKGSAMAGRAEEGIGSPETVSLQVSILAAQFLEQMVG